jgi:hypothetical protein
MEGRGLLEALIIKLKLYWDFNGKFFEHLPLNTPKNINPRGKIMNLFI